MATISTDFLFYSQVLACTEVYSFTACYFSFSCSGTIFKVTFCICFEAVSCCRSWDVQVGEVDNCFSISYCITIAIVVSQCNFLSCCIVFVYVFSTAYYTTFSFSATSFNCCRSDMKLFADNSIGCRFKVFNVYCCIWSCSSCIIKFS